MSDAEMGVVVRQYGLLPPLEWGDDCEQELRLMNRLWNRLVEIERGNRSEYQAATEAYPDVARLDGEISAMVERKRALADERKGIRKAGRAKVATPEHDRRIAELSARIKDAKPALKEARSAARIDAKPRLVEIEEARRAAVKLARQESGLFWSNYNAVIASYDAARQRAMKEGAELRFHRHDGSGRLVNQIQGGLDVDGLFAGRHSQVKVAPVPALAWSSESRSERRRLSRTTLTATVHTRGGERRNVTWPMVMHRPLPDGAIVKSVEITRKREADRWRWAVTFTCRSPDVRVALASGDACGIDPGWRMTPAGLRVATVALGSGQIEHVCLDDATIDDARFLDELRGRRDDALNAALAPLRVLDWSTAPEGIAEGARPLRSPKIGFGKVAALVARWQRDHAEWQPEALAVAVEWLRWDRRAWRQHAGMTRRVSLRRREQYRILAARLCADHGAIGIEGVDWRELSRRENRDGSENEIARATGWYRKVAAPGELLSVIRTTAAREGVRVHIHSGKSSFCCHACAHEYAPIDPAALFHRCPACGVLADQDVNAALVLRSAALDSSGPVMPEGRQALEWDKSLSGNNVAAE